MAFSPFELFNINHTFQPLGQQSNGQVQLPPRSLGEGTNAPSTQSAASSNPFAELGFGDPHPLLNTPSLDQGIMTPPGIPSQEVRDRFLPPVFTEPFLDGLRAAGTTGSYAGMALPGAGAFQSGLYNPGLNPMEANFLGSSALLGSLGLETAMNRISDEYAMTPFHSSKGKQYADAGNQFAAQMMNTGSNMALQRQQMAAQNLPNVFQFPLQAAASGQQSAAGLYNAFEQGMLGDTKLPMAYFNSYPVQSSVYVQPPAGG